MKSYGQYCAVAKALDLVGDRWTLLIVRELLIRGSCRYTDIREGLPGVATNLLAERLAAMEECGLVVREEAAAPVATPLYRLTERGLALEAVLGALGTWGAPLLAEARRSDVFLSHWLVLPSRTHLRDHDPNGPAVSVEVHAGAEPVTIEAEAGRVRARPGKASAPNLVLRGRREKVFGLLMGKQTLRDARKDGVTYSGDIHLLKRLHPG